MRELIQFAHWRQSSKNLTDKIFMIRGLSTVLCLWCGCDVSVYCNATHQIVECKVEWRFIFKQGNIWPDEQITARNWPVYLFVGLQILDWLLSALRSEVLGQKDPQCRYFNWIEISINWVKDFQMTLRQCEIKVDFAADVSAHFNRHGVK